MALSLSLNLHWYNLTCICIVTSSILASLFLIYKHRHKTDRTQTAKSLYESLLLSGNGGNQSGVETETDISSFSFVERNCLWRSSWSSVHPGFMFVFRIIAMAVLLGTLSWDWWIYDASIFIYYTEWTFLLVIIYFLIGALISAQECYLYYYNNKKKETFENLKIEEGENVNNLNSTLISREYNNSYKRAGILGYFMQIIYQICGGAVILTDVVFWCLLAPLMKNAHFQVNLVMGCMHSLNLIFLLIDTSLNSMNFPMFRMAYFVIWSCIYVIFQWILHLLGFSWWPYPFLKLSTPWAPLWYIAMALIHIPCYVIYWLIVKAKNEYFPILFPNCYVRLN